MTGAALPDLTPAAAALGELLRARGWWLATAESSTGGLIGEAVTRIAGASDYYAGGVIAYSNAAKVTLLGVDAALIAEHGAVSAPVAAAMARGVGERLGAEVGAAVTGIAGPDGGSPAKPVGTHYVAVAVAGAEPVVAHRVFDLDRAGNRAAAGLLALELAAREVQRSAGQG